MQLIRSLTLTLCFIGVTFAERSPVFLLGTQSIAKPSLQTVSSEDFANLVAPLLEKKALVVFCENDLRNKDFLCSGDDGKSCFARLQGVSDKTYYLSVENPIKTLRTIGGEHYYSSVDSNGELSSPLETKAGKITFLKFDDVGEPSDRASVLKLHDSIIASVTSRLGEKVFFIYASSPSTTSLKRQRRQASQDNSAGYVIRDKANFLLYYKSLSISEGNNPPTVLDIQSHNVKSVNTTALSVTLTPSNGSPITFDVTLAGGYFFMKNVMYNNAKLLSSDVYAPTDFSYFCGNLTLTNIPDDKVHKYTLKWHYLQFQAPFGQTKNESFVFGDAWHCVGFFTGGILSGLLIVALLLTITFIGVCWMMDINTMDRFDDPKGKTITINASE